MRFGFKQPLVGEKRCVTTLITAAEETNMTPVAPNICTRAVFTTSSFKFGLQTYFGSHCCYRRALYAVFYKIV